jgi:hypothetical protein
MSCVSPLNPSILEGFELKYGSEVPQKWVLKLYGQPERGRFELGLGLLRHPLMVSSIANLKNLPL